MKIIKTKKDLFEYVRKIFAKKAEVVLIRGSTANGSVKAFSDVDVEVYVKSKLDKPYYEIILYNNSPLLISAYFYDYIEGKNARCQKNVKVLFGDFNDKIKPDFSKGKYLGKVKIKRECQLVVDFLFNYFRNKNKNSLESVQKRIR